MPRMPSSRQRVGRVDGQIQDPNELLHLALGDPREALKQAERLTRQAADPLVGSVAQQTIGIVLRDQGRDAEALPHLQAAVRLARRAGDGQRVADARATLGAAYVMAGATRRGLSHLAHAEAAASGEVRARVLMREAFVLELVGRHHDAAEALARAMPGIRRAGDPLWEARALNSRAMIYLAVGDVHRAERDVRRAHQIFSAHGQRMEATYAAHNLGVISYARNDVPAAIRQLTLAAREYDELGMASPDLAIDRAVVLLSAGLGEDAVGVIDTAAHSAGLHATKGAELQLMSASASLSLGRAEEARERGESAATSFREQRRPYWEARALLCVARARAATGDVDAPLLRRVSTLADRLEAHKSPDAATARLLAGQVATALHHPSRLDHLQRAAAYRTSDSLLARISGWVARALLCEETDRRGLTRACTSGLSALNEYLTTFGSFEARAASTAHGQDLASLAIRQAARTGRARALLTASERWKAVSLMTTSVVPDPEADAVQDLAALRDLKRRLTEAQLTDVSTEALRREQLSLERRVRTKKLMLSSRGGTTGELSLTELMDELGDVTFVEVVDVDSDLYAVVVSAGRIRKCRVGTRRAAMRALNMAHFALHGVAHNAPVHLGPSVGEALERAVLGEAGRWLGAGPVVVSPISALHTAPWSLLPHLHEAPVSVTPSAQLWLRARRAPAPTTGRTVLISGPNLRAGPLEVQRLSHLYGDAVVLGGADATVESVLAAVEGASVVHFATHGTFRRDNPMFSSLTVADGELTVHDLDRLDVPPYRIVLSACDSGVGAPVGVEETLGLQTALIASGTAGVAASIAKVNDRATVPLMTSLHENLRQGADLPTALARARSVMNATELAQATAASFTAFGL